MQSCMSEKAENAALAFFLFCFTVLFQLYEYHSSLTKLRRHDRTHPSVCKPTPARPSPQPTLQVIPDTDE